MRLVDFRKMVDAVIESQCGLGTSDLPDFDLWQYFDENMAEDEAHAAAADAALDLLVGAPWDGLRIYGPFSDGVEAEEYQSAHLYGEDFWWIMPLTKEVDDAGTH